MLKFDLNVCTGYRRPEHVHPASELRDGSWLCPTCDDRLNAEVDADRSVRITATRCAGGDHTPGAKPYACLVCYGD